MATLAYRIALNIPGNISDSVSIAEKTFHTNQSIETGFRDETV